MSAHSLLCVFVLVAASSCATLSPTKGLHAKLESIKQQKVSAIKKEKSASDSVQQLLAALSKPDKAPAPMRRRRAMRRRRRNERVNHREDV